jgi:hypothetical protein
MRNRIVPEPIGVALKDSAIDQAPGAGLLLKVESSPSKEKIDPDANI